MSEKKLLFVYGSLRQGLGNHSFLRDENVSYLGNFITEPEWTMISLGGFPALLEGGNTAITGELYSVPEPVYRAIERLEGYPTFYNRKPLTTPLGEAEVYYIEEMERYGRNPEDYTVVEHGDWWKYISENSRGNYSYS
jgi:gamma-glutamylcyclotransferase (GGCT)/AIG2-like uncharacterized protein YtfP